jgi:hypothetical protein
MSASRPAKFKFGKRAPVTAGLLPKQAGIFGQIHSSYLCRIAPQVSGTLCSYISCYTECIASVLWVSTCNCKARTSMVSLQKRKLLLLICRPYRVILRYRIISINRDIGGGGVHAWLGWTGNTKHALCWNTNKKIELWFSCFRCT